jgi:hypothetical protein
MNLMAGHECYHCKQWVDEGEPHDCWTTTEQALTADLSEDLREAWDRLRETAVDFGEQRIYASHHCIMFARKTAYFFVRPKRNALEIVFFLGRALQAPPIRRIERPSKRKFAHVVHVTHRDQVEAPLTDWVREAYDVSDQLSGRGGQAPRAETTTAAKSTRTATARARNAVSAPRSEKSRPNRSRPKAASAKARAPKSTSQAPAAKTKAAPARGVNVGRRGRRTSSGRSGRSAG